MLSEAKHLALDKWVSLAYLQTSSHGAFTFRHPSFVARLSWLVLRVLPAILLKSEIAFKPIFSKYR
jgi:hypothetical protein